MMRLRRTTVALAACVLLYASGASAQKPSAADRDTARDLMDEGDKKRDAGDLKAALEDYAAADAIMHVPTTALEVARVQAGLGLLLEARETLARLRELPQGRSDPAPFVAARRAAEALDQKLAAQIPSIDLVITNAPPGQPVDLTVDDEPAPLPSAGAPLAVNPGAHVVVVRSSGAERRAEITVAAGERTSLTFDLAPPAPAPALPPEAPISRTRSTPRLMMYSGLGVAALGVAVGGVTGLMSLSKASDLKDRCPDNACPPGAQPDIDATTTLGTLSTVAFIAAGAGLAVGATGLVMSLSDGGRSGAAARDSARLRIVLGPTFAGVTGAL